LHVRTSISLETTISLRESLYKVIWIHMSNIFSDLNKCVYSFSHAPSFHMCVHTFVSGVSVQRTHANKHTYTHIHIHTYRNTHMHTRTRVHTDKHTHIHTLS